ncbi:hypothetical protein [Streptomyces cynarae]|uniref:hypothetical protein n=1 Tax=Streptomyces cynarae TaxID=2981134 RepID=UPI0036F314E2
MASPAARTALDLTADIPLADPADRYRDLHRHPELSQLEHRAAGKHADRLRTAGYAATESGAPAHLPVA